ncbi:MAG: hypothetical protein K5660_08580 [Paludibacteraceae bacterium]|nr:hypothetical protein [Paludibacteraceae bacterium]
MKITAQEISNAQSALTQNGIVSNDGTYSKEFNGYISSFGASLVQAGLLPTIIFFENKDASTEKDRSLVISALKQLLCIADKPSMAKYIIETKKANDQEFINDVTRAMTAMKLALRMYKKN